MNDHSFLSLRFFRCSGKASEVNIDQRDQSELSRESSTAGAAKYLQCEAGYFWSGS